MSSLHLTCLFCLPTDDENKCRRYIEQFYFLPSIHKVHRYRYIPRVPQCLSPRRKWDPPPTPFPRKRVCPPPRNWGGGGGKEDFLKGTNVVVTSHFLPCTLDSIGSWALSALCSLFSIWSPSRSRIWHICRNKTLIILTRVLHPDSLTRIRVRVWIRAFL
jgi:hypothetical protein